MEVNNQQIQNELFSLSDRVNDLFKRLMREESCMFDLLEEVQHYFVVQEAGKALISELTQAMREVRYAYYELEQLKGAIIEFTRVLTI